MLRTLFALTATILAFAYLSPAAVPPAAAKPLSQIVGEDWRSQCNKAGQSKYGCCQNKVAECRDGCQTGASCGNACTQCKNTCSSSYNACIAGRVVTPSKVKPGTGAAPTRTQ